MGCHADAVWSVSGRATGVGPVVHARIPRYLSSVGQVRHYRWINRLVLLFLHDAYGTLDLSDAAASHRYGLAKNRAFVDGNKRAAFLAVGLFLRVNGHRLVATQAEATMTMLELAAGHMDESAFAQWIRKHLQAA